MPAQKKALGLLEVFSQQLKEDRDPQKATSHAKRVGLNLAQGLNQTKEGIDLQTGYLDRVFDNLGNQALATIIDLQAGLNHLEKIRAEKNPAVLNEKLEQFIAEFTKIAWKQFVTPEGKLSPALSQFLDSFCSEEDKFSVKYEGLSQENQEHVKNSLIFSLAHAEVMAVMNGCLKDLEGKLDNASLDKMQQVATMISKVHEQIKTATTVIKKEERNMEKELLNFLNNCIDHQGNKPDVSLNSEAKRLNKLYDLGLKFGIRGFANNPQDQMLKLIANNYPNMIKDITHRYKGAYENGEVANPQQVAHVLRKAGAEGAAKEFETFVEYFNAAEKHQSSAPRKSL